MQTVITPAPDTIAGGTYEQTASATYEKYDTVHWERSRATSTASRFCNQMSESGVYMASTTPVAIHSQIWTVWDGQPTERSYPVPRGYVVPDGVTNEKSIQFRISHDESSCNSTQKADGCHFAFPHVERCYHWLLTAMEGCKERTIWDYKISQWARPSGYVPENSEWIPRVALSAEGIKWEVDEGIRCLGYPGEFPYPPGIYTHCWSDGWIERDLTDEDHFDADGYEL